MARPRKLYYWRKMTGRAATEVAEALEIHRVTVHRLESGRRRPSPELAEKIASLTGIPATEILADYESTTKAGVA